MLQMPQNVASPIGKKNLETFASSPAALEIDDLSDVWTVVEWSWTAGPPLRIVLRGRRGERMDVIVDAEGVWRIESEPVDPKIRPPSDLRPIRQ